MKPSESRNCEPTEAMIEAGRVAIMDMLKPKTIVKARPTIDELERILNSEDSTSISIEPDGSVVEMVPLTTTAREVARVAFKAMVAASPPTPSETATTIYVVTCGWDYEGSDVKAILSTRAEAEAVVEKYKNQEHFSYDSIDIEEWKIGDVTDRRWEVSTGAERGQSK